MSFVYLELNQIMPGLYLGSQKATLPGYLTNYGITHIVNISKEIPFPSEVYILPKNKIKIALNDLPTESLLPFFDSTFDFIDNAIKSNGTVLVHCQMGISRSATIVIAYVMRKLNITAQAALEYVAKQRHIINPNNGFLNQLEQYEKVLRQRLMRH